MDVCQCTPCLSPGSGSTPRRWDAIQGSSASSEPLLLLEMGARGWHYEALPDLQASSAAVTPISASPNPQRAHGPPRVNFQPENIASTRRSSAVRGAALPRRRSRSMSAWSDLSRSSFRLDERYLSFIEIYFIVRVKLVALEGRNHPHLRASTIHRFLSVEIIFKCQ